MALCLLVEVGEADGLGEPLVHQLLHGGPGGHVVGLHVSAVVALAISPGSKKVCKTGKNLPGQIQILWTILVRKKSACKTNGQTIFHDMYNCTYHFITCTCHRRKHAFCKNKKMFLAPPLGSLPIRISWYTRVETI